MFQADKYMHAARGHVQVTGYSSERLTLKQWGRLSIKPMIFHSGLCSFLKATISRLDH